MDESINFTGILVKQIVKFTTINNNYNISICANFDNISYN